MLRLALDDERVALPDAERRAHDRVGVAGELVGGEQGRSSSSQAVSEALRAPPRPCRGPGSAGRGRRPIERLTSSLGERAGSRSGRAPRARLDQDPQRGRVESGSPDGAGHSSRMVLTGALPRSRRAPPGRTSLSARFSSRVSLRPHVRALYCYARLVDELGDAYDGDRLAALDELEQEVDADLRGRGDVAGAAERAADGPRVRPAARAVPAADRGEPDGPADRRVRDVGRPEAVLRPLGRPVRPARARRAAPARRPGARRCERLGLHRASSS